LAKTNSEALNLAVVTDEFDADTFYENIDTEQHIEEDDETARSEIDVAQPIPPQAPAAAASSRGARRGGERGKAPLRILTPDKFEEEIVEEESDEDIEVYLNTAMFTTNPVRKC
jgi:hypothetical protein